MQKDSSQRTIIIATVSFIVGFCLAWLIAVNKDFSKIAEDQEGVSDETSLVRNLISVKEQTEGVRVILDEVSVENLAWAVIHEEDTDKPGRILGAQLFDAGATKPGTVDLLRGTLAGRAYYAMLHSDNGDRAFNPKNDLPIADEQGNPVMMKFTATATTDSE